MHTTTNYFLATLIWIFPDDEQIVALNLNKYAGTLLR